MNFLQDLNVPNSFIMFVGVIIILLAWQFLSAWMGEWARKTFKKQGENNRRKTDDNEWFNKFLEHHDALTKEIHEFTVTLMKVVESMASTNRMLSENQKEVADRHAVIMSDLKRIRNLTEGRK